MGAPSPFGAGWLPKVELFYSGVWNDVSPWLSDDGITITVGRSDEGGQPDPSRCVLRLKNADGRFSPRNPRSPLYGLIGRNTPLRVRVTIGGNTYTRFQGEVAEWPQQWTKKGAPSAAAQVVAAGVLRRLLQGASPLVSPVRRATSQIGSNLVAYWPMEDGDDITSFSPAVGPKPITWTGSLFGVASYAQIRGSKPLPQIGTARLKGVVPGHTSTGVAQVRCLTAVPLTTPVNAVLLRVRGSGTLGYAEVRYAASGNLTIEAFNDAGTSLGSSLGAYGLDGTKKIRLSLELTQSGGNLGWTVSIYVVGDPTGAVLSGSWTGVTLGVATSVEVNPTGADLGGMPLGHLTVENAITSLFAVSNGPLTGYAGELAGGRVLRLCAENGVGLFATYSVWADQQLVGVQGTATLVDLLREAADTDGGIIGDDRGSSNLRYWTRERMHLAKQTPVVIPYVDNLLRPFEPTDDDQALRNDITVTRNGGGEHQAVVTDGPLGTATVGTYDDSVTLSLASDDQCEPQATWRAHVGTTDETRWRTIGVDLADSYWFANTGLRAAVIGLAVGAWLRVTGLPSWLPPYPVEALVQGYTETIDPQHWTIEFATSPAAPYRAVYWSSGQRLSGEGTALAAPGITTTTQATFDITCPWGTQWTSADGPYAIRVNGEDMTVTSVTGTGTTQTMTVTRGANGVTKTHPAGSAVALAEPNYWPL